jgi:hypothetical protein
METAELSRLVDEAGFIFLGRVLHAQTSDERLGAMRDKAGPCFHASRARVEKEQIDGH